MSPFEEAVQSSDRALELNPRDVEAWSNKARFLIALEQYEESIQACDKALEIDPNYATAWSNKGNALCGLGKHDEGDRLLSVGQ